MARMIDQIRASKLASNMMQFAARGALQVPPAENIEILVYLAVHNRVFGELARMTLAGWDEKASRAAASDPQTSAEVLTYMIAHDNLRPALLPDLLANPSVTEGQIAKLAVSAGRDAIAEMLKSDRVRSFPKVLETLRANPYLKKEEADELKKLSAKPAPVSGGAALEVKPVAAADHTLEVHDVSEPVDPAHEETVTAYLSEHASEIEAERDKPFQAVGGIVELLGEDYFPVIEVGEAPAATPAAVAPAPVTPKPAAPVWPNAKTRCRRSTTSM